MSRTRTVAALVAAASLPLGLAVVAGPAASDTAGSARSKPFVQEAKPVGVLRVNQQGYLPHERKSARLMATARVKKATFAVTDDHGATVLVGRVPAAPVGSWSGRFPKVYRLDLSPLDTPGRYRLSTSGGVEATSPWFTVAGAGRLFGDVLTSGVAFDQVQRDGADVIPGELARQPSHLRDARARVYAWPRMKPGEDLILDRRLHRIGGPVDVEGGWFDAGDYLKFTHSTAYADVVLFTSARLLGDRTPPALLAEARHGLRWLTKMWDPATGTLYMQVGIGSGNRAGTFYGDHDLWRLPQDDDADTAPLHRFVRNRPVFRANDPGRRISPNLAGRLSAAFALAAQSDTATAPARARHELRLARGIYARAATRHPPRPLVTALPHAFYPESSWRDDMELGAAEIARAAQQLGKPAGHYLHDAARWAEPLVSVPPSDTLNLYDTSALAHVALAGAMRAVPHDRLPVTRADLVDALGEQIRVGVRHARSDPFGAAAAVDEFDVNSHSFGLVATVGLYDGLTGTHRYQGFASEVRTWLLGGDPWGVSAMVGIGSRFPRCMQHQVANLSGSTDGTPPLARGAVVNGPNGADNFEGGLGGFMDEMTRCPATSTHLRHFDGRGSRYLDDARAWQTNEPALDMTGAAIIAAASQLSLRPAATLPPDRRAHP